MYRATLTTSSDHAFQLCVVLIEKECIYKFNCTLDINRAIAFFLGNVFCITNEHKVKKLSKKYVHDYTIIYEASFSLP